MKKQSTYYAGRVIKLGNLTSTKLIDALEDVKPIIERKIGWTIIDVENYNGFVVGVLAKYNPESEINIVDIASHSEKQQIQQNMIVAKSPFIYIPEYSGIVFQKVSGHVEPYTFSKKFPKIIKETFDNFFTDCDVELITDIRSFSKKLSSLKGIHKISAKVNPPNPLFGPLWGPLKDYLKKRKAENFKIEEVAKTNETIESKIPQYIDLIDKGKAFPQEGKFEIDLSDAAILMAADGYGEGIVEGKVGNKIITIKTSETVRNFVFDKIPIPEELYAKSVEIFIRINKERHMRHDEE